MSVFEAAFFPDRDQLEIFDRKLETYCKTLEPQAAGMDLFIATHELLINSIAEMAALGAAGDCPAIHVTVEGTSDYLEAVVTDCGRGYDREELSEEDPNQTLQEEGRGLMMVDLLTDYFVTYTKDDGRKVHIIRKQI